MKKEDIDSDKNVIEKKKKISLIAAEIKKLKIEKAKVEGTLKNYLKRWRAL